uniref:Rx N-terminal domain-containing protein n=1 Tax=Leersia perrieri TaxID=77586 RepID=A0A0D9XVP4_9ORYZ
MAIVLDAFASYVGDLLKQVAQDELTLLFSVSGEIANLDDKLRSLRDYLADADKSVQGWVRELKYAMYDATDILDLCHLKAMRRSEQLDVGGCLNPLLFCLRNPVFAHDINARLDAISKSAVAFSFLKLEAYQDMAARRSSSSATSDRKTDPVLDRSGVVGEKIEEDTRALVKRLTNIKPAMNIMVFNHKAIQDRFGGERRGAAEDGHQVRLRPVTLATAAATSHFSCRRWWKPSGARASCWCSTDDVWDDERAWHGLLKAPFSHGAAVESSEMEELEIDDTLKDIGMQIIQRCDGLPLAVKVMGGLLRRREKRAADWEQVLQDFIRSVPPDELNDAIYLSYQDLNPCLRQCFLHYSLLPKNVDLEDDTVVGMWYLEIESENLVKLPDSIGKLVQLRHLDLRGISINGIPRQFRGLTNLRKADGDRCSLQELGTLAQLQNLTLRNLENVPSASLATEARLVQDEKGVSEEEQGRIEVFDELTPLLCLENIYIEGYFGQHLPRWMMSRAAALGAYDRLTIVMMKDLACCTQLPNGLCQLPCLHFIQVNRAPAIKRVGPEFVTIQPSSSQHNHGHAFPRLKKLYLTDMVEWEEWEWDQQLKCKLVVVRCPKMKALEALPKLQRLQLEDEDMEDLPGYLLKDPPTAYISLDGQFQRMMMNTRKQIGLLPQLMATVGIAYSLHLRSHCQETLVNVQAIRCCGHLFVNPVESSTIVYHS